jgi:RimJ/RimL family protein N-acetyltransferase
MNSTDISQIIEDHAGSSKARLDMKPALADQIRLRDLQPGDLPRLYEFNLDPEANRLAATIPRSAAVFDAHWKTARAQPGVVVKAILLENVLAGYVSCFKQNGLDAVGYWVGREFWGQGIASKALELLLKEVAVRPLHARVATANRASLRVLEKCGFVVQCVEVSPASERFLECKEAFLILK